MERGEAKSRIARYNGLFTETYISFRRREVCKLPNSRSASGSQI